MLTYFLYVLIINLMISSRCWFQRTILGLVTSPSLLFTETASSQESRRDLQLEMGDQLNIQDMRTKYCGKEHVFLESDLKSLDPIKQFKIWFEEATHTDGITEANAMCLATASKDGRPSARWVLMKGFGNDGFKFYTNYNSRKAQDLEQNPFAALTFYWEPLHRSVRIEGRVGRVASEDSDAYFASRPRASQIGAWVSAQSSVVRSRQELTEAEERLTAAYRDRPVPRPLHWGGYVLEPETIEFWQGQSDRIHDRIRFRRLRPGETDDGDASHAADAGWLLERLAP